MKTIIKKSLIASAAALIFSAPAWAYTDNVAGLDLQLNNRVTLGSAWRIESRDPDLVAISKGGRANSNNDDDGNLAFDTGDVVSAAAKITSDLTLSKGNFGLFVRGRYLFNPRLTDHDFFHPANYYTPDAFDPGYGTDPTGHVSVQPRPDHRHNNPK